MMSSSHPYVVVIAGGSEDIDSLARLLNLLTNNPQLLVVVSVHGFTEEKQKSSLHKRLNVPNRLNVIFAVDGQFAQAGSIYVASSDIRVIFKTADTLGVVPESSRSSDHATSASDQLFQSATQFHGDRVIGIVLSGLGKDGTKGLLAITSVHGRRIVQSPCDSKYPDMPSNALLEDHVQYSLNLDEIGKFLSELSNS